jgi:Zn finger protein HypA/HybF involved in hydrogenase expression
MGRRQSALASLLLLLLSLGIALENTGCKRNPAESSIESDANGFLCNQCAMKFYTHSPLFADHCPRCKSGDIRQVVGFLCYKDQHLTLTPQGPRSIACAHCGNVATGLKLPNEGDLVAWGATLQNKSDVKDQK